MEEQKIRTFQATLELRWEQRSMGNTCFNGQYVPPVMVLQQAWICREDGTKQWRDIPTFLSESLRPPLPKEPA